VVNYATVYFPSADEITKTNSVVTIKGVNLPPNVPSLTYPGPDAIRIDVNGTLFWKGHEPNNETLMYDVYLGPLTPPTIVLENTSSTIYSYTNLTDATTYYWKIVAKDPYGGVTSSAIQQFTVAAPEIIPIVNFTANITHGQSPLTVAFTDQSVNQPTEWNWSFGDGNFSEIQHPVHMYERLGTFTVSLNATNPEGSNTATRTDYITVDMPVKQFPNPIGGYFPLPTAPCPPFDRYHDIDGSGFIGFNDVVVDYNNIEGIESEIFGPISAYDFDRNGWIGFNDVIRLYQAIDNCPV
jgi:PKD repeat protein